MTNPKDWFRRRRREPPDVIPPEPADPFADGPIIHLGRDTASTFEHIDRAFGREKPHPRGEPETVEAAGPIPPPPPRSDAALRGARILQPEAFAVRPEITRSAESAAPPAEAEPARRRRAVPLPRRPAPGPEAESRPEPESRPPAGRPAQAEAPPRPGQAEPRGESEMPGFTLAAPGIGWMRGDRSLTAAGTMNAALREAFTPTRPKQRGGLFSGRYRQMQRIIAAIEEERAHVVLYGERGSGKTSLANIIAAKADEAGYFVLKLACSSELGFDDIFREFLRRVPGTLLADGVGASSRLGIENFEQLLPQRAIGVPDVVQALSRIHERHAILVIDEYDRVTREETRSKLAELIKNMSDTAAPVTLLIIGVAGDVDELLGKHPSLRRTLVTIPLPLMSRNEIEGIIGAGEKKSGLVFAPEIRGAIVEFAQGLPYHAQLLCLFAARSAIRRRSPRVEREDLRYALQRAAEEAENRVKDAYNMAIGTQGTTAFRDALFAASRCRTDEFGTFTVADVLDAAGQSRAEGASALAFQYPLKKLTEASRGALLRRITMPDGLRYQFCNQMMRHYVLVRQTLERGLV